jgi:hypothetical protein
MLPPWPFILIGLSSFIAFGLTGEHKGRAIAWLRFSTLLTASGCAIVAGVLFLFQEPWAVQQVSASTHNRRGELFVLAINALLAVGPQITGTALILTGLGLGQILPALWRDIFLR